MLIDKNIIKSHYEPRLNMYEKNHQILNWENKEAQFERFNVFIDNVNLKNRSVIDVGCGLGDLYAYLIEKKIDIKYTGIDILDKMIIDARKANPEGTFFSHDIFTGNPLFYGRFDTVFSSGLFNLKAGKDKEFLSYALSVFFKIAKEKIVFNLLDIFSPDKEDIYCYYSPDEIKEMIKPFSNKIKIIKDYLPNDFTVICDVLE